MSKRKNAEAALAKQPPNPPEPQEGYTWCPECQASYQGEVCPGCVDLSGAGAQPATAQGITPETRDAIVDLVAAKGLPPEDWQGETPLDDLTEEAGIELYKTIQEFPDPPTTLAEVAANLPDVETTTRIEILPVPLTDPEHKEISQRMAAANQEIVQVEIDLKAVKTQFKSRKESAEARRNECSDIINAGHQQKQIECDLIKDFRDNTITLVRKDTLEIVRTRTMTAGERQRGLFPGGERAEAAGGDVSQ